MRTRHHKYSFLRELSLAGDEKGTNLDKGRRLNEQRSKCFSGLAAFGRLMFNTHGGPSSMLFHGSPAQLTVHTLLDM